jgi:drug/metabolite transporter (DMT)-like permease
MAALLALCASALWGTADFLGGLSAQRRPAVAVGFVSQAIAAVAVLAFVAITGRFDGWGAYLLWGAAAGAIGVVGLVCLYRALADGTMGVVAPIAATGVIVPVVVGLANGERPTPFQIAGVVLAIAGVVLVSGTEVRGVPLRRRSILLALVAAVCLGAVLVFLAEGGKTSVPMTLLAQRTTGVAFMAIPAMLGGRLRTLRWRETATFAAIGLTDVSANGAFALASTMGLLSLTATLSSFYPVMTAALARLVLGQRLRRHQLGGVAVVLAGVILITT